MLVKASMTIHAGLTMNNQQAVHDKAEGNATGGVSRRNFQIIRILGYFATVEILCWSARFQFIMGMRIHLHPPPPHTDNNKASNKYKCFN